MSQSYSVGGSSDASIRCQYCSNLLRGPHSGGKRHKTVECPFVELRPVGPILEGTHVESPRDQLLCARGNVSSLTQPLLLLNVLTAKLQ